MISTQTQKEQALLKALRECITVLRECITVDGAACWKSRDYAEKRIRYIDRIARAAIAEAQEQMQGDAA